MQTKHLGVLIHICTKVEVVAPLNRFKPSSKFFYWPFQGGASFLDHLCYFCLVLLCFHARLFVDALVSSARKELTSWFSFVMYKCDVVTFPLFSWVRCGAWLYRFLIFALFLTFVFWKNSSSRTRKTNGLAKKIKFREHSSIPTLPGTAT